MKNVYYDDNVYVACVVDSDLILKCIIIILQVYYIDMICHN